MGKKKKFYAVKKGSKQGIFETWTGPGGAEQYVKGYPGTEYKSFNTRDEAKQWMNHESTATGKDIKSASSHLKVTDLQIRTEDSDKVHLYTDGSSLNNPGPGGFGSVLVYKNKLKELSGGYRLTTNNRMELLAVIQGLSALKFHTSVIVFSDSQYVVSAVNKRWVFNWEKNNWLKKDRSKVENSDLWKKLLELLKRHQVEFRWVKGHAGHPGNERCDYLAVQAANSSHLSTDMFYENKKNDTF